MVSLTSMGIVGEMLVEVIPGEGQLVEAGHIFKGKVMKDMGA